MDTSKLRAGRSDINDRVNEYYYSSDWSNPKKFPPRKLPAMNFNADEPSQVFYYTTHSPGNEYYATPTYWGGATSISTEVEIYNWFHSNIVNGLQPSLFVALNSGIPAPEQRQEIYDTLTAKYGGSNNPGKLMLTFANSKEEAPEITSIGTNGTDTMFIELSKKVQEAILTSHQISSPELLGIRTPGALGSPDHLAAQNHFQHLVIFPLQQEVLGIFNKLLRLRDNKPAEIEVKQFEMVTVPDAAPIETVNVNKDVAVDENKDETIV
jgi:hypothetical protein